MDDPTLLKISEIAKEANVLSSTIRHYTDVGLLRVAGYTEGGHRLFSRRETLERLSRIHALSKRGFSLPEIKAQINEKSSRKKVLVIDDEPEVRDLVTEIIRIHFPGWQVRTASDGFSAGKSLTEFYPDLVILDLMLPGVDGFEVCRQIRSDPLLVGISVLAITGYDSPEMKEKIMKAGANDYMAKPMDVDDLKEKIRLHSAR